MFMIWFMSPMAHLGTHTHLICADICNHMYCVSVYVYLRYIAIYDSLFTIRDHIPNCN